MGRPKKVTVPVSTDRLDKERIDSVSASTLIGGHGEGGIGTSGEVFDVSLLSKSAALSTIPAANCYIDILKRTTAFEESWPFFSALFW